MERTGKRLTPNDTKRYLITGGAGFIGAKLTNCLVGSGHVTVVDNLSTGNRTSLCDQVQFVEGDIGNSALLLSLIERVDYVIHLAACVSVAECIANWETAHRINLEGAVNVLRAAQAAGNKPVIYASSAAVYGRDAPLPNCEGSPLSPISPYGADKLGCENHAAAMWEIYRLPSVGLRFFNVYGEGQSAASPYAGVVSKFIDNRTKNISHKIYGDGYQSRDFVHVDDVVKAITKSIGWLDRNQGRRVFNVCSGRPTDLRRLASILDKVSLRGPLDLEFSAARAGDIRHSVGCPAFAQEELGFTASVALHDGLQGLWLNTVETAPAAPNGSQR